MEVCRAVICFRPNWVELLNIEKINKPPTLLVAPLERMVKRRASWWKSCSSDGGTVKQRIC